MIWRLNKIQYPVYNLGPGKRLGIWVQGCPLRCKGCINRTLWAQNKGQKMNVIDVFNWLQEKASDYDGITVTGGEPFAQYEALITFLHLIKKKTQLNVHVFSGYYLHELQTMFEDGLFKSCIDFLTDGRYIESQHNDNNLKGSTNQSCYAFINNKHHVVKNDDSNNKWSVNVDSHGSIYMAGIPRKNDIKQLCVDLEKAGIKKTFK